MEEQRSGAGGDLLDRAAEALRRQPVPPGPPAEAVRRVLDAGSEMHIVPLSVREKAERTGRRIRRIAKAAVAASLLAAAAVFVSLVVKEGSTNIAFADVAFVLEHLQSATFDVTMDMASPDTTITMRAKGSYLFPSRQRIEGARKEDRYGEMVIVADYKTAKGLVLLPAPKVAVIVDSEKIKDQIDNPMAAMFEMMRCLVREGHSGLGKVVPQGKKEIGGRAAVGFFAQCSMGNMTLWADLHTARPIRIELDMPAMKTQGVLDNFRYDVPLDSALFSLKPPAGYLTLKMGVAVPAEDGLIQTLRAVAEQRNGMFPLELGINREVIEALQASAEPDIDAIAGSSEEQAAEVLFSTLALEQKYMQGLLFYLSLKPENEAHYAGGGVKLGTPNRPIFWYRPSGSKQFRVIYADLHVQQISADEAKALPTSAAK